MAVETLPSEVFIIVDILDRKKAEDIVIIDVRDVLQGLCDYFVIATSLSPDHGRILSDLIEEELKKREGIFIHHIEGYEKGTWILVDTGGVVVHIFNKDTRKFYDLESLYSGLKTYTKKDVEIIQNKK